jgi:hypothetical protein
MAAEADHFMTGDILFFIFHQGRTMAFDEMLYPSEVTDGAFTGGILGQIAGCLHSRGRGQKKQAGQQQDK